MVQYIRGNRSRWCAIAAALLAGVLLQAVGPQSVLAAAGSRPNIVFIMADDK